MRHERQLSALSDPTPDEVEALRTREVPAASSRAEAETTRILTPQAPPPAGAQKTRIIPRPP